MNAMHLPLPGGFQAAAVNAGIREGTRPDLAVIASQSPAVVAGVFTRNRFAAAPVQWCRQQLAQEHPRARAIVVNSGVANACTGEQGHRDVRRTAECAARHLGAQPGEIFVCSTGKIGVPLPMDRIEHGVQQAIHDLSPDAAAQAAEAMLTTDTRTKTITREITLDGETIRWTGMAKGAGMIEPNMATMLAFLLTDACMEPAALDQALRQAVRQSFNRISVDGDMSTNDTVLVCANGAARHARLDPAHPQWPACIELINEMAFELAMMIIGDGEGARKVVTVRVRGAVHEADAERAARAVANSMLVKTSWVADSLDWGRVMDALGYSGAEAEEARVDIAYDGLPAVQGGQAADTPVNALRAVIAQPAFTLDIHLHQGPAESAVYSCDCTEEYVRINM